MTTLIPQYDQGSTGAINRPFNQKLQETVSVKDFGALGNGVADDAAAIQAAINYAATAVNGAIGATVFFPTGTYLISTTINMPNRVGLQGANGRGVVIQPYTGFSSSYMFHAVNGTTSMFGSWIKDMFINASGFNMIAPVYSQAWQETCGMERVVIEFDGTTQCGFLYTDGFGGAAYLRLVDIEIFSNSTYSTASGINIPQISSVGGFILHIDSASITGSTTNILPNGIVIDNDTLIINTYHGEYVTNMVTMSGVGSLSADTVTGSFNAVTNIISFGSTFTGSANLRNIIPNGATGYSLVNEVTGYNIPQSEGVIAQYVYDPSAFSYTLSANESNVTGDLTQFIIKPNTKIYDYLNEYNTSNGYFTPLKTGKYLINAAVSLNVPSGSTTLLIEIVTTTETYVIYRGSVANSLDSSGDTTYEGTAIVNMNAGDTAYVTVTVGGIGAKTVSVRATETFISGQWLSR